MKTLETIAKRILCLFLLLTGSLLLILWVWEYQLDVMREAVCDAAAAHGTLLVVWPGTGILLVVLGLLGLLSRADRKVPVKSISYPGIRGDIVIELEWVEATLNRVIGKLREVKWISVSVDPEEERGKASVTAEVKLVKGADESARETAIRVGDRLADTAANLLGVEDVTRVDLIVKGGGLQDAAPATVTAQAPKPAEEAEAKPLEPEPAEEPVPAEPEPAEEPKPTEEPTEVVRGQEREEVEKEAPVGGPEDKESAGGGQPEEPAADDEAADTKQPEPRDGLGEFPHGNE